MTALYFISAGLRQVISALTDRTKQQSILVELLLTVSFSVLFIGGHQYIYCMAPNTRVFVLNSSMLC